MQSKLLTFITIAVQAAAALALPAGVSNNKTRQQPVTGVSLHGFCVSSAMVATVLIIDAGLLLQRTQLARRVWAHFFRDRALHPTTC